ncbi:MAG: fibrillarin-like rRNA/tRNA 2'-O-methyltransferase [Candidatus Bathyarchaeia archaeon]
MEGDAKVKPHERFLGVYWVEFNDEKKLSTRNLVPGRTVYDERLVRISDVEYRLWDPYRSKLSAFIMKGGKEISVKPGYRILYLGAGTGTTVSHVSDIVGESGKVYCIEFSARAMRVLLDNLCRYRCNVYPILTDARLPERYPIPKSGMEGVYCDVAQPEQAKILVENSEIYLEEKGLAMIALKARSIDVTKPPSQVFEEEIEVLKGNGFKIIQVLKLEPYDKDHAMIVGEWNP